MAGTTATSAMAAPSGSKTPSAMSSRLYWDTKRAPRDGDDKPPLKNMSSRFHAQGACPRRLDHVNLLAEDVTQFRDFMQTCLGARVTEQIQLDNGRLGGCWFTVNNKTYDLACTRRNTAERQRPPPSPHLRHRPARRHPARRRHLP